MATFSGRLKRALLCTGGETNEGTSNGASLESGSMATRQKKQTISQDMIRNILVLPLLPTCKSISSCSMIVNHILREERLEAQDIKASFAVGLPNCETSHGNKTYSFNIATIVGGGRINIREIIKDAADTVPRYAKGLHLIIFVVLASSLIDDEGSIFDPERYRFSIISSLTDDMSLCAEATKRTEYTTQHFPPIVQSISLLAIIKDDESDDIEETIYNFQNNSNSFEMKKGIIPVSFTEDDFKLAGTAKVTCDEKTKEDEAKLLNVICHQCKNVVSCKKVFQTT